jgi:hypothetical protein
VTVNNADLSNQDFGDMPRGPEPTPEPTAVATPEPTSYASICNHPCPSRVRFKRRADDYLYLCAGIDFPADFNPTASEFVVEVRSGGDLVYSGTLDVGVVSKRGHRWRYLDRDARKGTGANDGIFYMLMSINRDGVWRWSLKAFTDMSDVTDPNIRVTLSVDGTVVYDREKEWTERSNGYLGELGRG